MKGALTPGDSASTPDHKAEPMRDRIGLLILAACLPLVMFAPPASAAPPRICEAFGHHLCLKATSSTLDAPVVEATNATASAFAPMNAGGGHVNLVLVGTNFCAAATNNGVNVVLHTCAITSAGIQWIKRPALVGPFTFENFDWPNKFLAGANSAGSQYKLEKMPTGGFNERFTL
jgi:hypothetical protein